ncbi:MAG: serine protease [Candidatus Competibacter sp.]|nr:serine protease [Candidatus Competibacter sp.]
MNWDQVVKKVTPHIVKIETPDGHGTGFLAMYNHDKTWCGIATAAHVVSHADEWQQPIKIRHNGSKEPQFLKADERVIFIDWATDSAVILFFKCDLQLPELPITLFPVGAPLDIGAEIGWLGFPAIEPFTLCFFSGTVSARQEFRNAYLVDGVAINGVSGGPVVYSTEADGTRIVGIVSAYRANRATGEALPGLLIAQDVSHFHSVSDHVRSIDEANKRKKEFESRASIEQQS